MEINAMTLVLRVNVFQDQTCFVFIFNGVRIIILLFKDVIKHA